MLCECGCGLPAPIATKTDTARGYVKGQPFRWRKGHRRVSFAERFARYVFCHGDPDACWPWRGSTGHKGYGKTSIGGKFKGAHVETYRYFKGELPDGKPVVRHTCDQPACCNPTHLIAGTHGDNTADMMERDRQCRGERNGQAILTDDIVREIRASYTGAPGEHGRLAQEYGVSRPTVSYILQRKTWKHI